MDPVTVICAVGLGAAITVRVLEKRADGLPMPLPAVLADAHIPDSTELRIVGITVREVTLPLAFDGKKLKAQLKYGTHHRALRCEPTRVEMRAAAAPVAARFVGRKPQADQKRQASAQLCSTSLFLCSGLVEPRIRFRLVGEGPLGRTVATASFRSECDQKDMKLPLHGRTAAGGVLGSVTTSMEVFWTTKGALIESLRMIGAQEQQDAFCAEWGVLDAGVPYDDSDAESSSADQSFSDAESFDSTDGNSSSETLLQGVPLPAV